MTGFLTQSEWARRLGVSIRTFRRWRAAGFIPLPDGAMPGRPHWSEALVEKTRLTLNITKRGLLNRQQRVFQPRQSSSQQINRSLDGGGVSGEAVSQVHAESVERDEHDEQINSITGNAVAGGAR